MGSLRHNPAVSEARPLTENRSRIARVRCAARFRDSVWRLHTGRRTVAETPSSSSPAEIAETVLRLAGRAQKTRLYRRKSDRPRSAAGAPLRPAGSLFSAEPLPRHTRAGSYIERRGAFGHPHAWGSAARHRVIPGLPRRAVPVGPGMHPAKTVRRRNRGRLRRRFATAPLPLKQSSGVRLQTSFKRRRNSPGLRRGQCRQTKHQCHQLHRAAPSVNSRT